MLVAAILTWILPAGQFQRREDASTGRSVVVAGTYARVPSQPVGPFQAIVAIPKGIVDAASVIGLVFLIGGAFTVVERTGTLGRVVGILVQRVSRRGLLVIPIAGVAFSLGGIMMQMQEELIAFVPVLLGGDHDVSWWVDASGTTHSTVEGLVPAVAALSNAHAVAGPGGTGS